MSSKPPVTAVITRTKNRTFLLERAIQSLQGQSLKSYVHVIVNDGGSREEVEKLLAQYPDNNRTVIHNKVSKGLTAALNQGIGASDSEFIAILDDDDSWHKDRLKVVGEHFINNPSCQAGVVKMDVVEERIVNDKPIFERQYLHPDSGDGELSLYKQCARNYVSNGIVTYRRSVYDELGGYDESLPAAEDWDFGIRLMKLHDVDLIPSIESLFFYHQRLNQVGDLGNSVKARMHEQEVTINKLRNKYLREDIKNGTVGVGYIMNNSEHLLNNVVRLEGHVNRAAQGIISYVSKQTHKVINSNLYHKTKKRLKRMFNKETHA